jgi:hypothetical protein
MTKPEAHEILKYNTLKFNEFGIQTIPVKTAEITSIGVLYNEKNDSIAFAQLFGLLKTKSEMKNCKYDFSCSSYMVHFDETFYFRNEFNEAIQVIAALQTINDYSHSDAISNGFIKIHD